MDRPRACPPQKAFSKISWTTVGGVLQHVDLLPDDGLFLLDLLGGKPGLPQDVRQQIHRQGQMVIGHLDVERGQFLAREGVHDPAHGIDGRGDVEGAAALRALEEHMLDEVRHTVVGRRLVPGTATHPNADGDGPDGVDFFGNDGQTVIENGFPDHGHPGLPFCSGGSCPACRFQDLTITSSPSWTMSVTLLTRSFARWEMWTSPSVPGRISTKAPKSTTFFTVPV